MTCRSRASRLPYPEALLRGTGGRPVYFVYDSYHIPARDWSALLSPEGPNTLRGGPLDGVFIGLWLTR